MKKKVVIGIIVLFCLIGLIVFFFLKPSKQLMINLSEYNFEQLENYAKENNLILTIKKEYSSDVPKDKIVSQSILENTILKKNMNLEVVFSLGIDLIGLKVDESGNVPIMMYHGIHDYANNQTNFIGGNVDKEGYQRTKEAFVKDLEFYYNSGYRMIRLNDYVNGSIDVKAGYSPIVLTFDDGLENNIKVTGLDENGNIIIDPNSAVGVLEQFKTKYPDFNVTATFFLNGGLFRQSQYNAQIIKWLVEHGYDIGNHTYNHPDLTKEADVNKEVASIYQALDKIIPDKYVKIVALPFGSPYKKEHPNFNKVLSGNYNGYNYETIATLRVGWDSNFSPFHKNFDKSFMKRIRAYDNNGKDFDITMCFKNLEKNRYISDGNKNAITIPSSSENQINNPYNLELIKY